MPVEIESEPTILVPAALLAEPLGLIFTAPAETFSAAARTFSNCAVPAPSLVIVFPVAVRSPVNASVLVAGVTVIWTLLLSTTGAAIVWLPVMTLIVVTPLRVSSVIVPGPASV